MNRVDWIIAPLALICFVLSLIVIPIWVPLPDLIIVCLIAVVMAAYDFGRTLMRRNNANNRNAAPR